MKAWRIYGPGQVRLDEMEAQPVGESCVKLKMLCSSLSISDNAIFAGEYKAGYPLTLGRQCVAMVSETGDKVAGLVRGNKVVVNPFASCHTCTACLSGKAHECERMLTYGETEDGFLRDFAVVPAADLYLLPDRVSEREAVFVEHIATAVNAVSSLKIEKGEHIVIAGATVTGMITAQVALYYQAVPILVDVRQDRLDVASSLGIYYTVNAVDADPVKKVFSLTGGHMAEAVAYMTAAKLPLSRSLSYAARCGRVAIVGWSSSSGELTAPYGPVLSSQLTVTGVSGTGKNMASAINMLANKSVSVEPFISKEISFAEVGDALAEVSALPDKYVKVLVKI